MAAGRMTITDNEIIEYFAEASDPVFSAGECATDWDMTHEGARGRLNALVDEGQLQTKKPGSRTRVYWLDQSLSSPESSEASA